MSSVIVAIARYFSGTSTDAAHAAVPKPMSLNIIGDLLDMLFDRVNGSIKKMIDGAEAAAVQLEIEAGKQIALAIENAKNAYQESLKKTIDEVGQEIRDKLNQLQSIVDGFEKGAIDSMRDLEYQAQQFVNTLPYANKQPQLTRVSPRYVVVTENVARAVLVKFRGNFLYQSTVGYEPSLIFGEGKGCPVVDSNTQELIFAVSPQYLGARPDRFALTTGTLTLPWGDLFKTNAVYKVGLGVLPQYPGTIEVFYEKRYEATDKEKRASDRTHIDGYGMYHNRAPDHKRWNENLHFNPTPGWEIDAFVTPRVVYDNESHGKRGEDYRIELVPGSLNMSQFLLHMYLYVLDGHNNPIFDWHVEWQETRKRQVVETRVESVNLKWGDTKLLEPKEGEVISKVVFKAYDGSSEEFGAPSQANPYLKVIAVGNGKWQLRATPPTDLTHDFRVKVKYEWAQIKSSFDERSADGASAVGAQSSESEKVTSETTEIKSRFEEIIISTGNTVAVQPEEGERVAKVLVETREGTWHEFDTLESVSPQMFTVQRHGETGWKLVAVVPAPKAASAAAVPN